MVPRATADLNSSPAMESQLINPPPSPTCVEPHSTVTSTFPNNSFNDVMGQLMNQLGHEVNTMKFHQITSNPSLTSIGYALAQSAMEKHRTPVEEKKYEEYTSSRRCPSICHLGHSPLRNYWPTAVTIFRKS